MANNENSEHLQGQVINMRSFSCDLRDENRITLKNTEALRESIKEARSSEKFFKSASVFIKDILSD